MRDSLKDLLPRKIIFADVGARGDIPRPWADYRSLLEIVCFEPDDEEYRRLQARSDSNVKVFNCALWCESAEMPLYLTRSRGCSSLLKPNFKFLNCFPESDRFTIEKQVKVKTVQLDELHNRGSLDDIDFLKIDVQGTELAVMQGGKTFIGSNAVGIELEVEFAQMYEDQPLFAEIDLFMRNELKMHLQDIRKTYWKRKAGVDLGSPKGQLICGDALYLRPIESVFDWLKTFPPPKAEEKLLTAISVAMLYGYFDYGMSLLLDERCGLVLSEEKRQRMIEAQRKNGGSLRPRRKGIPKLAGLVYAFFRLVEVSTGGWATYDLILGSRKRWGWFQ